MVDAIDRVIGDTANHFAQVGFGIEAVELSGFDERIDCGGAYTAGVGSCEQIVLAAQGERSDCALGGVLLISSVPSSR